jgi:hypothetical protein
MLMSHKLCRWALPWALVASGVAVAVLAPGRPWAQALLAAGVTVLALGIAGWLMSGRAKLPRFLSIPAFLVAGNVAAIHAFLRALMGDRDSLWEPTRREVIRSR